MNERQGISIAVLTDNQDDVELVNGTLRDGGHAAHCFWIETPAAFEKVLADEPVELVVVNCDRYSDTIRQIVKQKDAYVPEVPVIALQESVDESDIQLVMQDGACDLVSTNNKGRLQGVVGRELRAYRVERALNSTLTSATEYRRQLTDFMQGSTSAIARIQEGIVTDVNPAWLAMFGGATREDAIGLPLMDNFEQQSMAAIKGALTATLQGKWQRGEKLQAKSSRAGDKDGDIEMEFQLADLDDGPFVQIRIPAPERAPEEPTKLVHEALKRDPTSLFFHRAQFLDRIRKRIAKKPKSGMHAVAYIKADKFSKVRKQVGILATEDILAQFSEEVRKRMHPRDVAGRFEGTVIMVLLERGNERDAEVWAQQLIDHIQDHEFKINEVSVSLTCSVGVCGVSSVFPTLDELVGAAADAHMQARKAGGSSAHLNDAADEDTRLRKHDAIWVKRIKAALMESRFQLAHLPIAGLRSDSLNMYDMLVRMIDEQGDTVLPSEFIPVASRNNLMKSIDRWILTAAIEYCNSGDADRVFVRISEQSILDKSLLEWMNRELGKREIDPARICIQIPEQLAARNIKKIKPVVDSVRGLGVAFALEHYGVEKNRFQILDLLKPDYIKIDGELMHSLTTDMSMQASVRELADAAIARDIETIAERVENANAMAVLFQLGIHYMQGHYVHEPEVVLQEAVSVAHTTLEAIANH